MALLDAQAGIEYEGEEPPAATDEDRQAIAVWNQLHNGHGAIDWAGLPLVCAVLGVTDVESLLHRLLVIKTHKPDKPTED